jgi:hypothetical protein
MRNLLAVVLMLVIWPAPAVTQAAEKEKVGTVSDASSAVNPMTGKRLSLESLDRILEEKKRQSAIAQEDLKIDATTAERELIPEKTKSEKNKLQSSEALNKMPPPMLPKVAAHPYKIEQAPAARVIAPVPATPQLAGIMKHGGEYFAIVESGQQSVTVKAGERAFGLRVDDVQSDSATINGQRYAKSGSITRIAFVDRQATPSSSPNFANAPPMPATAPRVGTNAVPPAEAMPGARPVPVFADPSNILPGR